MRFPAGIMTGALFVATTAHAADVEVPFDIAAGPSLVLLTGKAAEGAHAHVGLHLAARTIWDRAALSASGPSTLTRETDEVRRNPAWWAPDLVVLPIALGGSGSAFGASWRPIAVGIPLLRRGPLRIETTAGARLTVLSLMQEVEVETETGPETETSRTLFFRPGVDLRVGAELALTERIGLSLGWTSMLHLPQAAGGSVLQFGRAGERLGHIGTGSLALHVRVPVRVK